MWMRAQTAVNDMFEIKINELEGFCSQWEESPNESDHSCQVQTLQTKTACSFIHEQKEILFKEKQNIGTDRGKDGGITLSDKEFQLNDQPIWNLTGKHL